jgi:hypothetical protein
MKNTVLSLSVGLLAGGVAYHGVDTAYACSCLLSESEVLILSLLQVEQLEGEDADLEAEQERLTEALSITTDGVDLVELNIETDVSFTWLTFQISE